MIGYQFATFLLGALRKKSEGAERMSLSFLRDYASTSRDSASLREENDFVKWLRMEL